MPPKPQAKKSTKPAKSAKRAAAGVDASAKTRLYVLDTNVLMHDPACLFRFEEHDIFLPMIVLEEMDNHKTGVTEVARNVRQATRNIDQILATHDNGMDSGASLTEASNKQASGNLFFQADMIQHDLPPGLSEKKADNEILGAVQWQQTRHPGREIILVSKDVNIRIKARALNLRAEDYFSDQVVGDSSLLPTGLTFNDGSIWVDAGSRLVATNEGKKTAYQLPGKLVKDMGLNDFLHIEPEGLTVRLAEKGKTAVLKTLHNYQSENNKVCGIIAKNVEQNCALNLLMDPTVDFVTLMGKAGSGKTLLALATAIQQTIFDKKFGEILVTRATIPVGEEIGFLPGTEEEKMNPWMGAIFDNLDVLSLASSELAKSNVLSHIASKIKIRSMSFMRGRTFQNKFVIIDEAQNLTPKQMKTLITRAGQGTKIICLGNIEQIDTPYLTEGGSGLTYVVERFRNWAHSGHLTLRECVRSRLSDYASEVL